MNKTFSFTVFVATGFFGLFCFVFHANGQPPHPKFSNERFVIKAMNSINSAQATYFAAVGSGSYGSLEQLKQSGLIDDSLATGQKYAYRFVVTASPAAYTATATPALYRKGGLRSFFINQTGELHGGDKQGGLATVSDPYIDPCALWGLNDNERCTIMDMRDLNRAQEVFRVTAGNGNYGDFNQLYFLGLIRGDLADGVSRGYVYVLFRANVVPPNNPARFYIKATPHFYGTTGTRSFFIDQTGVLRGADKNGMSANETDPPIN